MAELQGVFPNLGCPGNDLVVYICEVPDILCFIPQMSQQAEQNIKAAVHASMTCTGRSVRASKLQSLLAAARQSGASCRSIGLSPMWLKSYTVTPQQYMLILSPCPCWGCTRSFLPDIVLYRLSLSTL